MFFILSQDTKKKETKKKELKKKKKGGIPNFHFKRQ